MTGSATTAPTVADPATSQGGWLAFGGITMLIASLTMLRRAIGEDGGDLALSIAYSSLPQLTIAGIVAGATVGLWIHGRYPKVAVSMLAGLVTGALASAAVLVVRGMPGSAVAVVALLLALAGALGGALTAVRPIAMVRGGCAATLAALVLFIAVAFNSSWLLPAFGADGTDTGTRAANGLLAGAQALTVGLIGGFIAYFVLRRSGQTLRWPAYLIAGGMPGLLWIIGDLFTRIGSSRLLSYASTDAAGDRIVASSLGAGRINTGLVLFFVGGLTAMIAFGRSLPRAADDEATAESTAD